MGLVPARRDDGPATVTVAGTVTANQGAPGAQAWPVDGSAHVQPVSSPALDTLETVDGTSMLPVYDRRVRTSLEALRLELELRDDGSG